MPSRAADRLIADARRAGAEQLETAIEQLADLELDVARRRHWRQRTRTLRALRAIQAIATE